MKKIVLSIVTLAAIGGSIYAYRNFRSTAPKFTVTTAAVTRGDVVDTVGATGTLQAVTTVQVGTQVSGTIQSLYADFNSLVRKGQVLARLDPSLFQTQIEQARANLIRSEADLERLRVTLADAQTKLTRAKELADRQLLPRSELDAADVAVRTAQAQIRSQEAQVTQSRASLSQNEVNLQHTVIEAPIDGLVISRSVDVGQTVAASMQAPTLFVLAADLTKMQVIANLDESDVGRIRPGQPVTFRVDAYPAENFSGSVSQVRLEPKVQQNVVTYATVIDVPNRDLKLKPGMTANVNIEIARSNGVLRVPNSALRFRPTNEIYAALGQAPPDPATLRDFAGRGARPAGAAPAAPPAPGRSNTPAEAQPERPRREPPAAQPRNGTATEGEGSGGGRAGLNGVGGGRGDLAGRMANLTPEQQERMRERMRARGIVPGAEPAAGEAPRGGRGSAPAGARAGRTERSTAPAAAGGATTIDALFGPLPRTESPGRVWIYAGNQLTPVRLRVGITDGQLSEVLEGDLTDGQELVTNVALANSATRPAPTAFPFGQPGRGGPGGFGGGGGGNNRGGGSRR
jgi:HlyD family secretion protein